MARHTEIVHGLAHELSNATDRTNRPPTAADAEARYFAYLNELAETAPRGGLGAATGHFIDHVVTLSTRYGAHLFKCFDEPKIPSTTNGLEGFFSHAKRTLRHTLGCGSTTNTVVTNLGAEVLLALRFCQQPDALATLRTTEADPAAFRAERARIAREEAPAIQQRSMVRHLDRHLARLQKSFAALKPTPLGYA